MNLRLRFGLPGNRLVGHQREVSDFVSHSEGGQGPADPSRSNGRRSR